MNREGLRIQLPRCPDCGRRVYYRTDGTKTEADGSEEHECPGRDAEEGEDG